mmetsp:Transcript_14383/g.57246  ORF Transcript_14383/g.57246 Transcript_14383/m.57246 type:complete len:122 (+) Transcript_14383:520-885(+)
MQVKMWVMSAIVVALGFSSAVSARPCFNAPSPAAETICSGITLKYYLDCDTLATTPTVLSGIRGILDDDVEPIAGNTIDVPVTEERYVPEVFHPVGFASAEVRYEGTNNITVLHAVIMCGN